MSAVCLTPARLTPARTTPARHRRVSTPRPGRALDAVARVGSLVTLGSLLVLATAVGGLADGTSTAHDTTVTVTFGRH